MFYMDGKHIVEADDITKVTGFAFFPGYWCSALDERQHIWMDGKNTRSEEHRVGR